MTSEAIQAFCQFVFSVSRTELYDVIRRNSNVSSPIDQQEKPVWIVNNFSTVTDLYKSRV
jgi:hypothetical protein